jgi:hypothetical protein
MADTFQMELQEQDEWCWAAVSLSVERYFSPTSPLTQCMIAGQLLGARCCDDPEACNQPAKLQDALKLVRRLTGDPTAGPLSFTDIQKDLDGGRPVCLRIGWDGGGGHFVILVGYGLSRSGARLVEVEDPLYGSSIVIYEEFISRYLSSGQWTATYPV